MSDLSRRIEALSPEKRLLLNKLRKQKSAAAAQAQPGIKLGAKPVAPAQPFSLISDEDQAKLPGEIEDAYPLTMLQLGMLYHLELSSDVSSPVYHNVNSFHLTAPLDIEAFRKAVARIVARHAFLRTSFELTRYSEPLQLVHKSACFPVDITDISMLSESEREEELLRFFEVEKQRRFNLSRPPLIRFHIHRRSEETFQLTIAELHAISDGWSQHIMLEEIFKSYLSILENRPQLPDPPLTVSYRDFVALERAALRSEECQKYWTEKLEDCTVTNLPRWPDEYPGNSNQKVRKPFFYLSSEVVEGLRTLALMTGVPIKSVLLAAHTKVLSILTGQNDNVTGLVSNGRPEEAGGERMCGLFLNTLPFRSRMEGGTWADLAQQTFQNEVEMLPFRRYPMAELQKKWGRKALFETTFTYLHFHSVESLLKSGKIGFSEQGSHNLSIANFTLSVVFFMSPVSNFVLSIILQYDETQLRREQVEAIYGYYNRVLRAMASDPLERHDLQSFLSDKERHQVVREWNQSGSSCTSDRFAHKIFEDRAAESPDAIAVTLGEASMCYGELNRRANQVAHYLQLRGVGPEVIVGICVDRSLEMITGLLSILKAGGAYVPLDPSYPADRLAFMLNDMGACTLLTQQRFAEGFPGNKSSIICLDDSSRMFSPGGDENPVTSLAPENLAYLIYTSGSTGQPKAVMISHRNLMRSTSARFSYYKDEVKSFLLLPSFAFDSSVAVIFWTLCKGGTLVLSQEGFQRDPIYLAEVIDRHQVSHLLCLPQVCAQLLTQAEPQELASLRAVIVAGEACPKELIERHDRMLPGSSLFNEYGPTEGTVWSSVCHCAFDRTERQVPIGRPVENAQIYILRSNLQPGPVGAPGELCVGGEGVARGYMNRANLTAEKFIPNPFGANPGGRLYKTGDLALHLPDGNIEFLGRIDHQVKIRGHRIETEEVNAVLNQYAHIKDSVVVARDDAQGNKRLVAYITCQGGKAIATSELRKYLSAKLPDYMIPLTFVIMDCLPFTPNGKLDRAALPAPDFAKLDSGSTFIAPRTPTEEVVAEVWAEVLGLERAGIHDNFFISGGHSLLATQIISRLRQIFQTKIPLQLLFDGPTVSEIAAKVDLTLKGARTDTLPPIEPAPAGEPLPLSFAQRRLWFLDQLEPGTPLYNIPAAVRLEGELDLSALERSLSEIVRRHSVLRATFAQAEGQPFQRISPAQPLVLPLVDLSGLQESEREPVAMQFAQEEARRPFDLSKDSLLRATLLRLSDDEHIALLTMHHIACDAWSVGVFIREISQLYEAFSTGKPSPLSELMISYGDYANYEQKWMQGEMLEQQLAYWQRQLSGAPLALDLPADGQRHGTRTFKGNCQFFELPLDLSIALSDLARHEGATTFMVLLAAFYTLLYRYSGQDDIIVGAPVAGRGRTEIEGLIGFFVNILALRADLSGNPTFLELISRVRSAALAAYAHQDIPFEKIVEELQPDRAPGRPPLFQVVFTMQNAPMVALELPGLRLIPLRVERGTAKYELVLNMWARDRKLAGSLEYNTDLFNDSTVAKMLEHFKRLLERIIAQTATHIGDFELLSEQENTLLDKAIVIEDLENSFSF
jgi:amino acid adenylation domain-containing protein